MLIYSEFLIFKYSLLEIPFRDSFKFEIRREEFGDAGLGIKYSFVLYFISDFEKDIVQFDFSNTKKKIMSRLAQYFNSQ